MGAGQKPVSSSLFKVKMRFHSCQSVSGLYSNERHNGGSSVLPSNQEEDDVHLNLTKRLSHPLTHWEALGHFHFCFEITGF